MGRQSVETLTMENPSSTSFNRTDGFFMTTKMLMIACLAFLAAIIATGVIVHYASAPGTDSDTQYSILPVAETQTKIEEPSPKNEMPVVKKRIDVRLPTNLIPTHYTVRLIPYVSGNFTIDGYVEATFTVAEPTNKVVLHINDIITHNDTAKVTEGLSSNGRMLSITKQEFDKERQFYTATLSETMMKDKNYTLSMSFEAYLNTNMDGFYRSSYKDESGMTKWLAGTQFQATDARKAFPCFDEPALKAKFSVSLARQSNMTSISNMPIMKTEPVEGKPDWFWDIYETSVPMSTYLVAFVVSDFTYIESKVATDYKFRVWARKGAIEQAKYADKIGAPISQFFEQYFNVTFPLPKQDMIALPDFSAGAMENWGLITYRETAMLYDPAISRSRDKQRVGTVITHELAHQWFGNLVTPSWWTDLWLNEGFASYMEFIGYNAVEPTFKMLEQFVIMDLQNVFRLDCLTSSHPINIPVQHPDEINEIFDRISYQKGSSIIRMMNHFLTENTFKNGLTNYLSGLKYQSAEQEDLWRYLTEQAHADGTLDKSLTVKTIMDTWTLQMGFPVINVTIENGRAKISQERFLLVQDENNTDTHDYKWWVPITFSSKSNPRFMETKPTIWMKPTEPEKFLEDVPTGEWVILNNLQTGYYRVNYDGNNWNMIIDQLITDPTAIHVVNRAQLIDDSLSLSRAGMLDYQTSMKLLSYLKFEDEYIPWASAMTNLAFIQSMFSNKGGYGSLKQFLLSLVVPMYDKIGFSDDPTSPHLDSLKRTMILSKACQLSYKPCVDEAVKRYREWMVNPDTIISPNLKSIVTCTAIREGDIKEWRFAWSQYEKSNVAAEKRVLLYAMGCTKKTWILSGYLERAITPDSGIRKQDATSVIGAVSSNIIGAPLAFDFLKDRWGDILEYYGSVAFTLGRVVSTVASDLNTRNDLLELTDFRERAKEKLEPVARTVSQAFERTKNNIAWMDKHYDTILQWLKVNGYDDSI